MSINELMTDDIGKVDEFNSACDDMVNSRYILAEGRIIKIMQTVALSTVLQRVIGGALKGFDYAACAREWTSGLKLPSSPKDHVALVFCILADIDNRKIFLNDFLRRFFWNGDINSAYSSFCATLIVPFKNYVVGALKQAETSEPEPRQKVPQRVEYTMLERKAMNLASAIERYNGFGQGEKEEYIFMCDSIATKARNDISGARALAIGLRRLIGNISELNPYVSEVVSELGY